MEISCTGGPSLRGTGAWTQAYGHVNDLAAVRDLLRRLWADLDPGLRPGLHACNAALGACSRHAALGLALNIQACGWPTLRIWLSFGHQNGSIYKPAPDMPLDRTLSDALFQDLCA